MKKDERRGRGLVQKWRYEGKGKGTRGDEKGDK